MTKKYKIAYKVIISIAILMLISIVVYKVYKMNLGVDDIKNYVESFGKLGPIIYIIMFSLVPLTLFPDSILAISSGLIFGLVNGYIYTAIGALIGGTIGYLIGDEIDKRRAEKPQVTNTNVGDHTFLFRGHTSCSRKPAISPIAP